QIYTFTATDGNGCTATSTATVTQPTAITFAAPTITNVSCNGGNNGKVVVSASGGTGTFTYSISPTTGTQSPSGTFNNLTAQTYTFTATDGNGCTATSTATVTQPTAIIFIAPTITNLSCNGGNNGKIVVSASGGTAPITYSISPNIGTQSPSGTFNNLTAQTYTFTATDGNGCIATSTATVTQPTAIIFAAPTITNVSCNGGNNGKIVVSASGGTAPITYSISPNIGTQSPSGTFNNLTAQTYTFTATDGNGCIATSTATVTQPTAIIFAAPTITNVSCNGGNNGKVVVSASGGTAPITYSISPNIGTQSPSGTFNNLTAQTYTFTATDGNGCTATSTAIVTQPTAIIFAAPTITNVSCNGGNNGKVVVSASGGTAPITYSINPNIGTQSPAGTFNNLTAQTYTFTATDGNGCTATSTAIVTQPTAIIFAAPTITNVSCNGGNNGKVVVSASGGTGSITYSINPNIGTQSPAGTFNNLTAQTYTFTATDGNGCTATSTAIVTQPTAIIFAAPT